MGQDSFPQPALNEFQSREDSCDVFFSMEEFQLIFADAGVYTLFFWSVPESMLWFRLHSIFAFSSTFMYSLDSWNLLMYTSMQCKMQFYIEYGYT